MRTLKILCQRAMKPAWCSLKTWDVTSVLTQSSQDVSLRHIGETVVDPYHPRAPRCT